MRIRPFMGALASAGLAALLLACGLTVVGEAGGAPSSDAGGTGTDASGGTDAGDVRPSSCERCATPADGWAPIALVAADAPCPSGSSRDDGLGVLLEGVRSTGTTCECTCGAPTTNPCHRDGTHQIFARVGGNGPCDQGGSYLLPSGACEVATSWSPSVNGISSTPAAPRSVTCPAAIAKPPVESDAELASCAIDVSAGACAAGEICLDVGPCLVHEGAVECPAGFGGPRIVTPSSDVVDERTCGACTCRSAATACVDARLSLFTSEDCTTGEVSVSLDGKCNAITPIPTVKRFRYSATPSPAGCTPDVPKPPMIGALRAQRHLTICCAP